MYGLETRFLPWQKKRESAQGFARSGDFSRLHTSAFSAAQNSRQALILRRPPDAQTSSPVGFFRADCPQKPHVPAKSPSCSLQPRPDSLKNTSATTNFLLGYLGHSPSPFCWEMDGNASGGGKKEG